MNAFENWLWQTRIRIIKSKMHLYAIWGNSEGAEREYQKVVKMIKAYYDVFLS